jgi:hypothetical protein
VIPQATFIRCASTTPLTSATPSSLRSCPVTCGTHGLATPVTVIFIRFFSHLIFIVQEMITLAMPVVLAKAFDFHFLIRIKLPLFLLLCYIVMFGRHLW